MRTQPRPNRETLHVGIDVARKTLAVAIEGESVREFSNNEKGWEKLVRALQKAKRPARVVLEATGSYHFDLACALARAEGVEVMVVNPRTAKAFHLAQSKRAKTDAVDAGSLLEMARRMDFVPWSAPTTEIHEFRQLSRYVDAMVKDQARLKNQLHAASISTMAPRFVIEDIQARLVEVANRIKAAEKALLEAIKADPKTTERVRVLMSVPGIGAATAIRLATEFLVLDPEMTPKQITAYAGLDPRPRESGTSVRGARGISRFGNGRLRHMLYMPAMGAISPVGPFKNLHERVSTRSGTKMVGLVAVMRKLLVTAWAIFQSGEAWDAARAVRGNIAA